MVLSAYAFAIEFGCGKVWVDGTSVQTNGSPAIIQASGNKFFRLRAQ